MYAGLGFLLMPVDPPFTDTLGNGMFFEPQLFVGNPQRLPQRLRRDFLTSLVTAVRGVADKQVGVVLGLGQGAVIAAAITMTRLVETALASKIVTHTEAPLLAAAWSRIRAALMVAPCITKALSDVRRLGEAVPELFESAPSGERLPLFDLKSGHPDVTFERGLVDRLGAVALTNVGEAFVDALLDKSRTDIEPTVTGSCACGRAALILSRCSRCVADESAIVDDEVARSERSLGGRRARGDPCYHCVDSRRPVSCLLLAWSGSWSAGLRSSLEVDGVCAPCRVASDRE